MADNKLLAKLLKARQDQNFDDTDSLIASTILHPITAAQKAGNWFSNQVNTSAGTGIPYDDANPFYVNDNGKIEAAANLAGFANVSGMPFAPKSNGATLGTVLKPSFRTPYEEAHEIARINAAKPISKGGLGLPENNTAMDRARALGFDIDKKWFHGTKQDFQDFDPEKNISGGKGSLSFTEDPVFANNHIGAGELDEYDKAWYKARPHLEREIPEGANILPVYINKKTFDFANPEHLKIAAQYMQEKYGIANKKELDDFMIPLKNGHWGAIEHDLGKDFFKQYGFDNAKQFEKDTNNIAVYDPSQIRSINAAFDPLKRNSANLLASTLLGSLLLRDKNKK